MRLAVISVLLTLIQSSFAYPPEGNTRLIPEIVQRFEETRDLWSGLQNQGLLPGFHSVYTNTPPTNAWLNFLQEHGVQNIRDTWGSFIRKSNGDSAEHDFDGVKRLLSFARDPLALRQITLQHSGPRHVAEELIIKYAEHLQNDPRTVLVYRALKQVHFEKARKAFRLESSARSVTSLPGIGAGTASEHEEPLQAVASTGLTAERSSASLQDKERGRSHDALQQPDFTYGSNQQDQVTDPASSETIVEANPPPRRLVVKEPSADPDSTQTRTPSDKYYLRRRKKQSDDQGSQDSSGLSVA